MGIFDRVFNRIKESGNAFVQLGKANRVALLNEDEIVDDYQKRAALYQRFKRAYERIPLITAIVDVQADQTVQNFYFEGPDAEDLEKWAERINLMNFFHKVTKCLLIYGNAFIEIVYEGDSSDPTNITELKVINPIWMDVWRKDTGDIIGYTQIIGSEKAILWGSTGIEQLDQSEWKKKLNKSQLDNIAHFKVNQVSSEKYGRSVIAPLMFPLQNKLDMEEDLRKVLYKYVAPLIWAKVGNDQMPAGADKVSEVATVLKDLSAESEVTTSHLVDLKVLDFNAKGMDIKTPINHMEQQIITGGQVPPVLLGRAEGTDKAQAEVQLRAFGRRIKSIQRELKHEFEDKIINKGKKEDWSVDYNKLIFEKAEEREWEIDVDILRGLVTDGILTAQKANDLLPPKFREDLPEIDPLNMQGQVNGQQIPRDNQMKNDKVKDNPNDPTQTTKDKKTNGKRVNKTDREVPIK